MGLDMLQAFMAAKSHEWQNRRAATQMTLGDMLGRLEQLDDNTEIFLGEPMSYRGYYCDIAFEPTDKATAALDLRKVVQDAIGATFCGYKGGDFTMTKVTPVWVAEYGRTGERLVQIFRGGSYKTEPEPEDND